MRKLPHRTNAAAASEMNDPGSFPGKTILLLAIVVAAVPTCAQVTELQADFNSDRVVDWLDFSTLALHWTESGCTNPNWCSGTDIDHNGTVGWADFVIFTGQWLRMCDVLIEAGDLWQFLKGRPGTPPAGWNQLDFDDSDWQSGPTGIGFGDGDDATILSDMQNNYVTVYARRTFRIIRPDTVGNLVLEIDYDDGFVAYINGIEIARRNLGNPGDPVDSQTATTDGREAGVFETIPIVNSGLLVAGDNVLAVEVHNWDAASSDLSLIPRLVRQQEPQNVDNAIYVDPSITPSSSTTYNPATRSTGSGNETVYKTLQGAAAAARAGDTVLIRAGTYTQVLRPQYSGTAGAYITYKNYNGEQVTITGTSLRPGIDISGRDYLIIDGLKIDNVARWMYALDSHYNIIRNNRFSRANDSSSKGGLFFQESTCNRVLDNIIEDSSEDSLALHKADRNLIEGNEFRRADHTLWTIKGGNFNVLRNNYFHNADQKIGEVYDMDGAGFDHQFHQYDCTKYNLIEGNSFAYVPSAGDSSPYAGIQYAGQKGIIRKNLFYDTVGPGVDMTLYSAEARYNTDNKLYNNVFYKTDFAGVRLSHASYPFYGNVIKNNIFAKSIFVANDRRWSWYTQELAGKPVQFMTGRLNGFIFENNNLFNHGGGETYLITYGVRTSTSNPVQHDIAWWHSNYPSLFRNNTEADPLFVNEAGLDFHLRSGSPMIDAGAFLTSTVGSGSGASMPVEDVGYFYDGYDIPGEQGDLIQLQGHTQTARIVDIDYDNNILILETPLSWTAGQGVGLTYSGSGPDMGAYEF